MSSARSSRKADSDRLSRSGQRAAALPLAAKRHAVVTEVAHRLADRCDIEPGSSPTILVGLSGGPDSVGLLAAMLALAQRGKSEQDITPRVVAAHINHHLRPEACEDQLLCQTLCERFGVDCHVRDIEPRGEMEGVAAAARRMRYAALADVAEEVGCGWVAVAHHADDQFETMLMALCRGAGVTGLAGMPYVRPLADVVDRPDSGGKPTKLIRPLLGVPKAQCIDLCRAAGLDWREDPTNLDSKNVRGRLRSQVTPVLDELWPGASQRAARAAVRIGDVADHIESVVALSFGAPGQTNWQLATLAELPRGLIGAGLQRAVLHHRPDLVDRIGGSMLDQVADHIRSASIHPLALDWPGGVRVRIDHARVEITFAT